MRSVFLLFCVTLGFSASLCSQTDQIEALIESGHFKQLAWSIDITKTSDAETLYLLSIFKEAFGKTDEAVQYADRAVKADPNRAKYHLQLAGALSDQAETASLFKKLSLAGRIRSELETSMKLEPRNTDCLMGMMMFYQQAPSIVGGSKNKAKQLAKEIGELDTSKGYLAQAQLARKNKDKQKLEGLYLSAVNANPKSVEALVALGRFYALNAQKH